MISYSEDFELWARECVVITDKMTGQDVAFVLNAAQRRLLGEMERQRRAGKPVRVILLKARQWGASTLVQVYMAWLQLVVRRQWSSLTCAHVKDAASALRGMYTRLLRCYPEDLKSGDGRDWTLSPYERSQSISRVAARDALVAIGSAQAPNALRGLNVAMAHLSEVAFWGDGAVDNAEDIVRTVCGSVALERDTVVVMESTANGTNNYFYREWQRSVRGESDKVPVFVAWHEIEIYRRELGRDERERLLSEMDDYERALLERGVSIESVAWYHEKRREYPSHEAMMAEYPSTAEETFRMSVGGLVDCSDVPVVSGSGTVDFGVLVASAPGRKGVLSAFSVRGGRLCCEGDYELEGSASAQVREAMRRVGSGELAIVDLPLWGRRSVARRCASVAMRGDVRVYYADEDEDVLTAEGERLTEMSAVLSDLVADGRYADTSEEALAELRGLRAETAGVSARAVARVAAARVVDVWCA